MSPFRYGYFTVRRNFGLAITVAFCHGCERDKTIELSYGFAEFIEIRAMFAQYCKRLQIQLFFALFGKIRRVKHFIFKRFQLIRTVSFRIGNSLSALIIIGHLRIVLPRNFDKISE